MANRHMKKIRCTRIYIYTCIHTHIYTCVCVCILYILLYIIIQYIIIYYIYNGVLLIIRKSEILPQMDLENIMPTEINQTEKNKFFITYMWNLKIKTNECK